MSSPAISEAKPYLQPSFELQCLNSAGPAIVSCVQINFVFNSIYSTGGPVFQHIRLLRVHLSVGNMPSYPLASPQQLCALSRVQKYFGT